LKPLPLSVFFTTLAIASVATALAASASSPSSPQAQDHPAPTRVGHAPTNLQVLPNNLTEGQVRSIMENWATALGTDCSTCHVRDPRNLGPNGRPRFNYADDSREEKKTARVMYRMTQDINTNYLSKVPNSGLPVSCGTCHRGHLGPEPFTGIEDHLRPDTDSHPTGTSDAPAH
jgi:Photosynthetic reaction centre cytochrome C subunit